MGHFDDSDLFIGGEWIDLTGLKTPNQVLKMSFLRNFIQGPPSLEDDFWILDFFEVLKVIFLLFQECKSHA